MPLLLFVVTRPATATPGGSEPGPGTVLVGIAKPPPREKTVAFSTHLLAPFFNVYYVDANIRASKSLSVIVNASYFILEAGDWKTNTATLGAGMSYYFQGEALRRWYIEANSELMLSRWRHQPSGSTAPIVPGFTVNAVAGYRWIWDFGAVLDLGAGGVMLHFPSTHVETTEGRFYREASTKVYPTVKLNVGWAF